MVQFDCFKRMRRRERIRRTHPRICLITKLAILSNVTGHDSSDLDDVEDIASESCVITAVSDDVAYGRS